MEMLEREAPLAALEGALKDVRSGLGRLALVSGEAGIGKTSLVEAFTRSKTGKLRAYWGLCDSLFTPRPLGPLEDIAAQVPGPLSGLISSEAGRAEIFSAFLNELRREPAIVVFDDVHWADEATLDFLRFAGRRIQQTTTLLVLTYRDDELTPSHPLRSVLGDLIRSGAALQLKLPPLTAGAVRILVGDREIDPAALHRQTGGNPFFVTEVLIDPSAGIPATVRDAVLARAARLSTPGHAALDVAAVIGSRIDPDLLAAVVEETDAVEECMSIGVLKSQGDDLAFRHELARQTVLEAISPSRRRVLHRQVLDALIASPEGRKDLALLAHHAEAVGDGKVVLEVAPAAAREAAAVGAHRQAAALYELALQFTDKVSLMQRAELLESFALECSPIDERLQGIEALYKALEIWQDLKDSLKQGRVLAELANLMLGIDQEAESDRLSMEAIHLLEAHPPGIELARAYRSRASVDLFQHDIQESVAWAEKSVSLAEPSGDLASLLTARNTVGAAMLFLDTDRGCKLLEEGAATADRFGRYSTAAHAYAVLGSGLVELYQFRRAEPYLTAGLAYAEGYDLDRLRLYMLASQAEMNLSLGRWREAEEDASEVIRQAGETTNSRLLALMVLGLLNARRGLPDSGHWLDLAQDFIRPLISLSRLGLVREARAEAAWLEGDKVRTLEEANAVYDLAIAKKHPWIAGQLAFWRWKAGDSPEIFDWMGSPFVLQMQGDWQAAAVEWGKLGCPYERFLALADGDVLAQMAALEGLEELGARPAAENLRRKLQAVGIRNLPRGRRTSTLENPFGLTNRQVEILELLKENLTNTEISARLQISPKTVDHHVSAVLARLDVHSREEAAELARKYPPLISIK